MTYSDNVCFDDLLEIASDLNLIYRQILFDHAYYC